MRSRVEIVQVSDLSWYLCFMISDDTDVPIMNTLIPFQRLIYALNAARALQIHVDTIRGFE
jgi:hypothetical protein